MSMVYIFQEDQAYYLNDEQIEALKTIGETGNSRWLSPHDAKKLWGNQLDNIQILSRELPAAYWIEVRRSGFPLQSADDDVNRALDELSDEIFALAALLGAISFLVWIIDRRKKTNGPTTVINVSNSENVAINKSQIVESNNDKAGDDNSPRFAISINRPNEGLVVPVQIMITTNRRIAAFARIKNFINIAQLPHKALLMLNSNDEKERVRAVQILSLFVDHRNIKEKLLSLLDDPSNLVKNIVIDVVGEAKFEEAIPKLEKIVKNTANLPTTRNLAMIALAEIGTSKAAKIISEMITMNSWDDITFDKILNSRCCETVFYEVLCLIPHASHDEQLRYSKFILNRPIDFTQKIYEILAAKDKEYILGSLYALEILLEHKLVNFDENRLSLFELLQPLLAHDSFVIRYQTIRVLGRTKSPRCKTLLMQAIDHHDVNTRAFAIYYLNDYISDPMVLDQLRRSYIHEKDRDLKKRIGELLGRQKPVPGWLKILRTLQKYNQFIVIPVGIAFFIGAVMHRLYSGNVIIVLSPVVWTSILIYLIISSLLITFVLIYGALGIAKIVFEEDKQFWSVK